MRRSSAEVIVNGLVGELRLPEVKAESVPCVLIVAGSGPTDRNGNNSHGLMTDTYRLLADGLAATGVASLRFDKRGVGASRALLSDERSLRAEVFAADVEKLAAWLTSRDDVSRVTLLGHSEGGLFSLMAAAHASVHSLILAAVPGRPLGMVLREQLSAPRLPAELADDAHRVILALENGELNVRSDPRLAAVFRPSVQPFLRSILGFNPAVALASVNKPVLLVGGGKDIQVNSNDHELLMRARHDAAVFWHPSMSHTLKAIPVDEEDHQQSYTNPTLPLADGLIEAITAFVRF